MNESFKTCLFGGFDKQDVAAFIEQQSRVHRERVGVLEQEIASLRDSLTKLEEEKSHLMPQAEQAAQSSHEAEELRQQVAVLSDQIAALQRENEQLSGPAREYEGLKAHIADIEISAHRRTEEFRAEAVARLRELIGQQRAWCDAQRGHYRELNEAALARLRRAEEELSVTDEENFDRFLSSLQQLEDSLQ